MGRDALHDKLGRALQEPIASEAQVVYIIVELRKLMELNGHTEDDSPYFALNFYCSWAVHTKMSRSGAKRIVERFNVYQKTLDATTSSGDLAVTIPQEDLKALAKLDDTLKLSSFRDQLGKYLKAENLSNDIATDDAQWVNFLKYYLRVIEDCPLQCAAPLEWVNEVNVKVIETCEPNAGQEFTVMMAWEWMPLKDPIVVRHISTF